TLDIVVITVETLATEEIFDRMRLDEEALSPVHVPEPDRAAQLAAIPWRSEVVVADMKVPHVALAHAGVFRQHDLDRMPPDLEPATQPEHDIAQPAGLGNGGAFGRHHHDIHDSPLGRMDGT